jgi:hypothetical protein
MFNTEPPAGARAVPGGKCQTSLQEGEMMYWAPTVWRVKRGDLCQALVAHISNPSYLGLDLLVRGQPQTNSS